MVQTHFLGIKLRTFSTMEEAKLDATLCRRPLAEMEELRGIGGRWIYRSGDTWYDMDGMLPFSTKDLQPAINPNTPEETPAVTQDNAPKDS